MTPDTFKHWSKPAGEFIFRFLPDKDENNPYFWATRVVKKPPEQWPGLTSAAQRIVRTHFFQGFVVAAPDHTPDDRIYKLIFGGGIFRDIKGDITAKEDDDGNVIFSETGLHDPRMEDLPFDFEHGFDFKLIKSYVGVGEVTYAKYDGEWLYPSRPLSLAERAAIETYGLTDLKTWIDPGNDYLTITREIVESR